MLDSGMSVDEIKHVCKKSTKPKKKSTSKKLSKPEKVITVKKSPIPKIDIEGILSLFNTYEFIYEYTNYKYDDIGESSDKYRITEQNINLLGFGVSFDL